MRWSLRVVVVVVIVDDSVTREERRGKEAGGWPAFILFTMWPVLAFT